MSKEVLRFIPGIDLEGEKRQRLPYELVWSCASCGVEHKQDFSDGTHYLSYPDLCGKPKELHLYCDLCNAERSVMIAVTVKMELCPESSST